MVTGNDSCLTAWVCVVTHGYIVIENGLLPADCNLRIIPVVDIITAD